MLALVIMHCSYEATPSVVYGMLYELPWTMLNVPVSFSSCPITSF